MTREEAELGIIVKRVLNDAGDRWDIAFEEVDFSDLEGRVIVRVLAYGYYCLAFVGALSEFGVYIQVGGKEEEIDENWLYWIQDDFKIMRVGIVDASYSKDKEDWEWDCKETDRKIDGVV